MASALNVDELRAQEDEHLDNPMTILCMAALSRSSLYSVSYNPAHRLLHTMTRIVSCEPPVRDQERTGTCWLQAACALLDAHAAKRGITIQCSVTYLAYHDKLEKANTFVQRPDIDDRHRWHFYANEGPLTDGGTWGMFHHIVTKYGVVPREMYPRTRQSKATYQCNKVLRNYLRDAKLTAAPLRAVRNSVPPHCCVRTRPRLAA